MNRGITGNVLFYHLVSALTNNVCLHHARLYQQLFYESEMDHLGIAGAG